MIRRATEYDFASEITCESELRIHSLKQAYGLDVPFIQFFADEDGSLASIMDGVCTLYCTDLPNEEWCIFLQMQPDISLIHTSGENGAYLAKRYNLPSETGIVMRFADASSDKPLQKSMPDDASLQDIYSLLSSVFANFSRFDAWYVDTSHRMRHGCCHYAVERFNGAVSSIAMTVAEAKDCALIGCVATAPIYRGQGAATRCISRLINILTSNTIFIVPADDYSASLYEKLGFVSCGMWSELTLK